MAFFQDPFSLKIVMKGIGIGLAFLIIGIVIALVIYKKGLLTRGSKIFNCLAKAWLFYIPLVMAIGGAAYFGIRSAEHTLYNGLKAATPAITEYSSEYARGMRDYVISNTSLTSLSVSSLKDLIQVYVTTHPYFEAMAEDSRFSKAAGLIPDFAKSYLSSLIADMIIDTVNETLTSPLKLDRETLAKIWRTDIAELAEGGLAVMLVQAQMDAYVKPVKNTILTIWIILLLMPAVEIATYKLFFQKRKQENTNEQQ